MGNWLSIQSTAGWREWRNDEVYLSPDNGKKQKMIIQTYGMDFYIQFKNGSDFLFKGVLRETPDIGNSIFSFNYAYAPSYVAWYKTMMELGMDQKQADDLMWHMNEKMLLTVPKPLLHMVGKAYLNSFRKKAK